MDETLFIRFEDSGQTIRIRKTDRITGLGGKKLTDAEKRKMAHRYLLQFQGYEEAANLAENRYALASVLCGFDREKQKRLMAEYHDALKKKDLVRKRVIRALGSLPDEKSGITLWMLYVERKQPDEVAVWMKIPVEEVRQLKKEGLTSLDVPEWFYQTVRRREGGKTYDRK